MPVDAGLVKRNFDLLASKEAALAYGAYEALFAAHPELLRLFSSRHSAAGRQMVNQTLMYAIDHVHGERWVATNVAALGSKHVGYEVTEEMYGWFVDAMLTSMAEVSASEWSPEIESSWRELLWYLSDLMIAELPRGASAQSA